MAHSRSFTAPRLGFVLAALLLPCTGLGCQLLGVGMWIINPNDMKAEYNGLKNKRVAVVCRPSNSVQIEGADAADDIARNVAQLLKQNVRFIQMIPQKEVNDWHDINGKKSIEQLGKALKADRVVVIELEQFNLRQGRTLFQGQAKIHLTVHHVTSGDITELAPLISTYPPRNGVPVDVPESQFRENFIHILSGQAARRFYAHDSREILDQYYRE